MSLAELRALAADTVNGAHQRVWLEPSPAAGTDFTITVPSPQFWLPIALTATFTTSDADASRQPALTVTDGTTIAFEVPAGFDVAASDALRFSWVRDLAVPRSDFAGNATAQQLPCPSLPTGWTIGVTTTAIDTADQWSAIAITVVQITGGQPAQQLRREDAIRDHLEAIDALIR